MDGFNFFIDRDGHLRSGWRLAIFCLAFLICLQLTQLILVLALAVLHSVMQVANSRWDVVSGHGSLLISSLIVGWGCGALLEDLPFTALGCSRHQGWIKNFLLGSLLGAASVCLGGLLIALTRGTTFSFDPAGARPITQTLIVSILIFLFAGAAEEVLFRGYPLQTMTRANLAWVGVLLTSVPFAAAHLKNPNVVSGFTFINTALAGVWLAVAYLRTRSLWLPFGLHWSWNWAQGFVLGLPVSGVTRYAPAPLLKAINLGPDWLTGGAYGLEGGAACTIALSVCTLIIWRAKLFARADVPASAARS